MTTDIIREFDPNLFLPPELKNAVRAAPDTTVDIADTEADIDIQDETLDDDSSVLDEDDAFDEIDPPQEIQIISQTVRTAPDGRQVIDVVIEVDDVEEDFGGVSQYDIRISKA